MWLMPSYGRPHKLRALLGCPGGLPPEIKVMVNRDDPKLADYLSVLNAAWMTGVPLQYDMSVVPAGSRCCDALRVAYERWPIEPCYGLLSDDMWPVTPGWWRAMEKAAEDRYVVTPGGEAGFPMCRTAVCLGGSLVRSMGTICPAPMKHNFADNLWDTIASEFNLLRPLPGHVVEHHHHVTGTAPADATYARGSADFEDDRGSYLQWIEGPEYKAMKTRIAGMLQ